MKKIFTMLLALAMIVTLISAVSCGNDDVQKEEEGGVSVSRSFLAAYEKSVAMGENEAKMCGRVLMNLMSDGTLDVYVGFNGMGAHETARYAGTYTLGENDEFDETITFTSTYGEGEGESATVSDAVIIDGVFETPFYMITSMTSNELKFYETAPVSTDGDIYIGYLAKTGGMGAMVYAYALTTKPDGTFAVSIMQMASGVMHVWDKSTGTYVKDGETAVFTYDVMDGEGAVATPAYTSEATDFTETGLSVGFNIAQTTVRASAADFIKVN